MRSIVRILFMLLLTAGTARAEIIGAALSYYAPPDTLGGYEMTPFPLDERPIFDFVSDVPSPLGGEVEFSEPLMHRRVGQGWAIWSHGYTGDVYAYGVTEYTIYLPEDTRAFYFYAHQYSDSGLWITAIADGETTVAQSVPHYNGAKGFAFYQDDPAGPSIHQIEVMCPGCPELAVGEFGIAIPGPAALVLLSAGFIGIAPRRRRIYPG